MQKIFASIFDLSFKKFVTPQLVTFIFVLFIVSSGVSSVFLLKLNMGFIIAPIFFITSVVCIRVMLELVLAVFQIARYSAEVARRGRIGEVPEDIQSEAQVS